MKRSLLLFISIAVTGILTSNAQSVVPNNNLDAWVNYPGPPAYDEPASWTTLNTLSGPFFGGNPVSTFKSTDAHSGQYAARIKTVVLTTNPEPTLLPDTVGLMFTGGIDIAGIKFGYPFTAKPAFLNFYSKYTPNGADTAFVFVSLTKWNSTTSTRDTLAEGGFITFATTTTYALGSAPILYDPAFSTLTPDTATIMVSSSGTVRPKEGSEFFIDSFNFSGGDVGINEQNVENNSTVYPNPATNYAKINVNTNNAASVNLYSITGQLVGAEAIENKSANVNTSDFSEGLYFYSVIDKNNQVLSNGKFSVIK